MPMTILETLGDSFAAVTAGIAASMTVVWLRVNLEPFRRPFGVLWATEIPGSSILRLFSGAPLATMEPCLTNNTPAPDPRFQTFLSPHSPNVHAPLLHSAASVACRRIRVRFPDFPSAP
jgi:hypothetical protein